MENKFSNQMNVFAPTEEIKGRKVLPANTESFSGIIDSSVTDPVAPATPVAIVSTSAKLPHFAPAGSGDLVVGFVEWNVIRPAYKAGDLCQVSPATNVMYMEAGDAIDAGVELTMDSLTDLTVVAATSGDPVIGVALEAASASGQLIRVKIGAPVALA